MNVTSVAFFQKRERRGKGMCDFLLEQIMWSARSITARQALCGRRSGSQLLSQTAMACDRAAGDLSQVNGKDWGHRPSASHLPFQLAPILFRANGRRQRFWSSGSSPGVNALAARNSFLQSDLDRKRPPDRPGGLEGDPVS